MPCQCRFVARHREPFGVKLNLVGESPAVPAEARHGRCRVAWNVRELFTDAHIAVVDRLTAVHRGRPCVVGRNVEHPSAGQPKGDRRFRLHAIGMDLLDVARHIESLGRRKPLNPVGYAGVKPVCAGREFPCSFLPG